MTKMICPVCGYPELDYPIQSCDICPCCLCEFEISDGDWTYEELREDWLAHGARFAWGSPELTPPENWDALTQLARVGDVQALLEKTGKSMQHETSPEAPE